MSKVIVVTSGQEMGRRRPDELADAAVVVMRIDRRMVRMGRKRGDGADADDGRVGRMRPALDLVQVQHQLDVGVVGVEDAKVGRRQEENDGRQLAGSGRSVVEHPGPHGLQTATDSIGGR